MSHAPIEILLDRVDWKEIPHDRDAPDNDGLPYATHSGVFEMPGLPPMRCHRLSNGKAVFEAEDFEKFFEAMGI